MSLRRSSPVKRALTGPTRAVTAALSSFSPVRSIDSQPGMHALSVSGSLSAAHVVSTDAGTVRELVNSIFNPSLRCSRGASAQFEFGFRLTAKASWSGKRSREFLQAFEIVYWHEIVHVRQHRTDPGWTGLESVVAQQWIEPDEPPARLREAFHFLRQAVAHVAVESIADEQHHCALREEPTRPAVVELGETRANARAARPVGDRCTHPCHGDVDVAALEMPGDIGHSGAEEQRMHAVAIVGNRVQNEKQHARVTIHRS